MSALTPLHTFLRHPTPTHTHTFNAARYKVSHTILQLTLQASVSTARNTTELCSSLSRAKAGAIFLQGAHLVRTKTNTVSFQLHCNCCQSKLAENEERFYLESTNRTRRRRSWLPRVSLPRRPALSGSLRR